VETAGDIDLTKTEPTAICCIAIMSGFACMVDPKYFLLPVETKKSLNEMVEAPGEGNLWLKRVTSQRQVHGNEHSHIAL